jgi:hypothetical protein
MRLIHGDVGGDDDDDDVTCGKFAVAGVKTRNPLLPIIISKNWDPLTAINKTILVFFS